MYKKRSQVREKEEGEVGRAPGRPRVDCGGRKVELMTPPPPPPPR